jgi:histone H3/H4
MEKLLNKAGAERVSASAKEEMVEVLEEFAENIAKKAIRLAKHAGRKTVNKKDVKEAARE